MCITLKTTHKLMKCCSTGFGRKVGNVFRPRGSGERVTTKTGKAQRGKQRVKNIESLVAIWLCSSKTNECLYHFIVMYIRDAVSKRIQASSRDVVLEETHMKKNMRLS